MISQPNPNSNVNANLNINLNPLNLQTILQKCSNQQSPSSIYFLPNEIKHMFYSIAFALIQVQAQIQAQVQGIYIKQNQKECNFVNNVNDKDNVKDENKNIEKEANHQNEMINYKEMAQKISDLQFQVEILKKQKCDKKDCAKNTLQDVARSFSTMYYEVQGQLNYVSDSQISSKVHQQTKQVKKDISSKNSSALVLKQKQKQVVKPNSSHTNKKTELSTSSSTIQKPTPKISLNQSSIKTKKQITEKSSTKNISNQLQLSNSKLDPKYQQDNHEKVYKQQQQGEGQQQKLSPNKIKVNFNTNTNMNYVPIQVSKWIDKQIRDYKQFKLQKNMITALDYSVFFSSQRIQGKISYKFNIKNKQKFMSIGIADKNYSKYFAHVLQTPKQLPYYITCQNFSQCYNGHELKYRKDTTFKKGDQVVMNVDMDLGIIQWKIKDKLLHRVQNAVMNDKEEDICWVVCIIMAMHDQISVSSCCINGS